MEVDKLSHADTSKKCVSVMRDGIGVHSNWKLKNFKRSLAMNFERDEC